MIGFPLHAPSAARSIPLVSAVLWDGLALASESFVFADIAFWSLALGLLPALYERIAGRCVHAHGRRAAREMLGLSLCAFGLSAVLRFSGTGSLYALSLCFGCDVCGLVALRLGAALDTPR
jgi:hypothetical protein